MPFTLLEQPPAPNQLAINNPDGGWQGYAPLFSDQYMFWRGMRQELPVGMCDNWKALTTVIHETLNDALALQGLAHMGFPLRDRDPLADRRYAFAVLGSAVLMQQLAESEPMRTCSGPLKHTAFAFISPTPTEADLPAGTLLVRSRDLRGTFPAAKRAEEWYTDGRLYVHRIQSVDNLLPLAGLTMDPEITYALKNAPALRSYLPAQNRY